jgi:hypothetical protein
MRSQDPPYARVCPGIWDHAQTNWTKDQTILAFYVLTNPSKTTEGLYRMKLAHVAADLPGKWSVARVRNALNSLIADGFAKYDEAHQVVLIPQAMKYQRPDNENQQKAAIRKLAAIRETSLWPDFIEAASRYCPAFRDRLLEAFPQGYSQGIPQPPALSPAQALSQAPAQTPNTQSSVAQDSEAQCFKNSNSEDSSSDSSDPSFAGSGHDKPVRVDHETGELLADELD